MAVSAGGLVLAAVTPAPLVAMAGFLLAGLGVSVQSPLLTQAAGNLPAGGFTALFVGNRTAGLLTPLAMGTLAGTSALEVGDAMLVVVLPCAALLVVLAVSVLRVRPSDRAEVVRV